MPEGLYERFRRDDSSTMSAPAALLICAVVVLLWLFARASEPYDMTPPQPVISRCPLTRQFEFFPGDPEYSRLEKESDDCLAEWERAILGGDQ